MRWFKTKDLRSSIYALFTVSTSAPRADDAATMDQIREAMLALTGGDVGERSAGLARRIRYATDLQALWFMRGELMQLLAVYAVAAVDASDRCCIVELVPCGDSQEHLFRLWRR